MTTTPEDLADDAPTEVRAPAPGPDELPVTLSEREGRRVDLGWAMFVLGAIALTFLALKVFSGVGVPLLLAVCIAYALDPVVALLARRGVPRSIGAGLVLGLMAVAVVGAFVALVPVLAQEAERLPELVRGVAATAIPWIESNTGLDVPDLLGSPSTAMGGDGAELLRQAGPAAASWLANVAGGSVAWLAAVLGVSVAPLIAFYLLRDLPEVVQSARNLFPRRAAPLLERRFRAVHEALAGFVQGQLAVGGILGVLYAVGLWASGVHLALVIGLIAGFGNLVPYLGTAIGIALATAAVLLHWSGPGALIGVALTFVIGQTLEGFVITPKVVGGQVGLSPVAVIVAILAFGELFGFAGVLLAVPAAAVMKVVGDVLVERYQASKLYGGEPASL